MVISRRWPSGVKRAVEENTSEQKNAAEEHETNGSVVELQEWPKLGHTEEKTDLFVFASGVFLSRSSFDPWPPQTAG